MLCTIMRLNGHIYSFGALLSTNSIGCYLPIATQLMKSYHIHTKAVYCVTVSAPRIPMKIHEKRYSRYLSLVKDEFWPQMFGEHDLIICIEDQIQLKRGIFRNEQIMK